MPARRFGGFVARLLVAGRRVGVRSDDGAPLRARV
jgi:hypothetical protein